jgi:phenylacetate-CoA ligase
MRRFRDQTAGLLQRILGIRARVEVLPPDSLPRTDFKARRVVDDRDVFRELNRKLEKER